MEEQQQQQYTQSVPIGAEHITPDVDPALECSVNQVWTLYHLAQETDTGTLCTNVLSKPPFNGRAYIERVGPEHVLLTSQHSGLDSGKCMDGHTEGQLGMSAPAKSDATGTQQIKIPNYLLVEDKEDKRSPPTSDTDYSKERKLADQGSVAATKRHCPGYLSFSVPIDSFCGADWSCRPQFLQVTSDEGGAVYSPAFKRAINQAKPGADEDVERTGPRLPASAINMEWSFKISIKGTGIN